MEFSKTLHTKSLVMAMTVLMSLPVMATETIKAMVTDGYPEKSISVHKFSNFFIPEVNKRLTSTNN